MTEAVRFPWMPVDIADLFASPWFQAMKDFQRGWYLCLLFRAWDEKKPCHLPNDQNLLWMLAGAESKEYFGKHSAIVIGRFEVLGDGRWLRNQKQWEVYERQMAAHSKRVEAGRRGGTSKAKAMLEPSSTSTSVSESTAVLEVAVALEEFDGHEAFAAFCEIYPKADRSNMAQIAFFQVIERLVKNRQWTRKAACEWLDQRTKVYVKLTPTKFQKNMIDFLDKQVFEQREEVWRSSGEPEKQPERKAMKSPPTFDDLSAEEKRLVATYALRDGKRITVRLAAHLTPEQLTIARERNLLETA